MNTIANTYGVTSFQEDRLSLTGKWAGWISVLFVFSISSNYRLHFGGFLIHPYLIILPFAILSSGFIIFSVHRNILLYLSLFLIVFSLGSLQNINPLDEIIKVTASILTFLFFATAVRSEKDFMRISLGFVLCAVAIGYLGFGKGEDADHRLAGINALEGIGNKNAQSLFTLPGIFLAVLLIIKHLKKKNYAIIITLTASLFFIVIGVFLSANRSGWVGLAIICFAYLIYLKFSRAALVVFSILLVFSYIGISKYASDIVEHKITKTIDGYSSDEGRIILIRESLKVGLENPVLGVGKDELHRRMNKAVRISSLQTSITDTHFLTGYLFGATGIFTVIFFYAFLYWVIKGPVANSDTAVKDVRVLMISFVLLFFIRSFFTREILYSPTFIGGMGLLYSYYQFKIRMSLGR